jgi:hypothetical protein
MIAYFDCFSGISGDMTLSAFIHSGVPLEWLQANLRKLPLANFDIRTEVVFRHGIEAVKLDVHTDDKKASRNFAEIAALIDHSPLSEKVKARSLNIFGKLAEAEAAIHGCRPEEVHFHEVGGVDALVDIIGATLCLEYLEIQKICASRLPLGRGFVTCRHGKLPLPAPATTALLKGIPVYGTDAEHELVTPTGAAFLAALCDSFGSLPEMLIQNIGYGAGQRDIEAQPNLLRLLLGKPVQAGFSRQAELQKDQVSIIETCLDDMNPEIFGFLMEQLFKDGALDVYWIPIYMKKNRPGTLIQVLCAENHQTAVIERILSETPTLGVRYYRAHRFLLQRESVELSTAYGKVTVKRVGDLKAGFRYIPEYEECRRIALAQNIPLREVYEAIVAEANGRQLDK